MGPLGRICAQGLVAHKLPDGNLVRLVKEAEVRMPHPKSVGRFVLYDRTTNRWRAELTEAFVPKLPVLCVDQCGVGYSAVHYLQQHLQHMVVPGVWRCDRFVVVV